MSGGIGINNRKGTFINVPCTSPASVLLLSLFVSSTQTHKIVLTDIWRPWHEGDFCSFGRPDGGPKITYVRIWWTTRRLPIDASTMVTIGRHINPVHIPVHSVGGAVKRLVPPGFSLNRTFIRDIRNAHFWIALRQSVARVGSQLSVRNRFWVSYASFCCVWNTTPPTLNI